MAIHLFVDSFGENFGLVNSFRDISNASFKVKTNLNDVDHSILTKEKAKVKHVILNNLL